MNWQIKERGKRSLIEQLLYNRGVEIDQKEAVGSFLNPDFERDSYDPFLLGGVSEAVKRIEKAVELGEKVGVFADYDADGIPGAALMYKTLKKIDLKSYVYIPNREGGYGLSEEGIDYLISKGCTLIVTVDLGIKNINEALYCKEKKIDLIVTDHHLPGETLPEADCVINPKIEGDKYPFHDLCGCGVAFKLAQALGRSFPKELDEKFLKWNLDLVAISTIADVVSLLGENRVLAKYGLLVIRKTKNIGLQALIKEAKLTPDKIEAYTVGFQIAPRINAPGRIDHATKSFDLLVTEDEAEAKVLAAWLDKKNTERQEKMDATYAEVIEKIDPAEVRTKKILIAKGKWLKGVIGPVASRLVEKFYCPVILFAEDEDKFTGSARSVEGVNIVEALGATDEYLIRFGGHKGAAGVSLYQKEFKKFLEAIYKFAKTGIEEKLLQKKVKIDSEIGSSEIDLALTDLIEQLQPFGMGNPRPVFLLKEAKLSEMKKIGKDKNHTSLLVHFGPDKFKAVLFNSLEKHDKLMYR